MEIIRKANILNQDDLLLLENHSLDKKYKLRYSTCKNVTILMLLIKFVKKYPAMNDIIKDYVKKVPEEITICNEKYNTPMDLCFMHRTNDLYIETIKILIEKGPRNMINIETKYSGTPFNQAIMGFDRPVIKLMMEYDGINVTSSNSDFPYNLTMVVEMRKNIKLLNSKN